jgi:hypothetical protein
MEEKDYLKKQTDIIAKALADMLNKLNSSLYETEEEQTIDNDFYEVLEIKLDEFLNMDTGKMIEFLHNKKIRPAAMEKLAIFLYQYYLKILPDDNRVVLKVKALFEELKGQSQISFESILIIQNL